MDKGNTVVVIEHNLDVIKTADYIIDLGPEGGSGGGTVVCTGTPEEVAKHPGSYTGKYLADIHDDEGHWDQVADDGGQKRRPHGQPRRDAEGDAPPQFHHPAAPWCARAPPRR